MNKSTFVTAILLLVASFSFAQNNSKFSSALNVQMKKQAASEDITVWIYFTDKGTNLDQKLANASQNISERALARRKRSLKNKPLVTHYDIPVSSEYLQQVIPLLSKLRHESKWLNAVSAEVNQSQLEGIAAMDFIKKIDVVRKGKRDEADICNIDATNTTIGNSKAAFYNLNYGGSLTQLEQMNVPVVHDLGYTGAGMLICLMDSGFRNISTLPAFATMDVQATYDFVNDDENVDNQADDMGTGSHGTSTLSTIGGFDEGTLIGPAYGASYLLAKTENTDSETTVEEDNWVAAAEWAEGLGADITSTSLGYIGFDDGSGYTADSLDGNTATITIAGDILAGMGVLVVNSAGNSGNGVTTIGAPADGFEVFAIGAVTADGSRSGFSSVGPTTDGRIKPDVMAMGSGVLAASWNGGYNNINGTSFSCPLAAGAAALLWE
ncbi:MAG: serine protease AprX, partial [Patescibacteria group bacterium]